MEGEHCLIGVIKTSVEQEKDDHDDNHTTYHTNIIMKCNDIKYKYFMRMLYIDCRFQRKCERNASFSGSANKVHQGSKNPSTEARTQKSYESFLL